MRSLSRRAPALAKTSEEESAPSTIQAAKISAEPETATKEPAVVEVLPTSVWDTVDNMIKAKIVKLKFDPRSTEDDAAPAEADEAEIAKW